VFSFILFIIFQLANVEDQMPVPNPPVAPGNPHVAVKRKRGRPAQNAIAGYLVNIPVIK
jgi:hypothetical protein